jgi:Bax protein
MVKFTITCLSILLLVSITKQKETTKLSESELPIEIADGYPEIDTLIIESFADLDCLFMNNGFNFASTLESEEIPFIQVLNMRPSIRNLKIDQRKMVFIKTLLVAALYENEKVEELRSRVIDLLELPHLEQEQKCFLDSLCKSYRVNDYEDLKINIATLPPSLIVGQAIIESGWGRSICASKGNSIFGQHLPKGCTSGLYASGTELRLRTFQSISCSVAGFIKNLNRHRAYEGLRKRRESDRLKGVESSSLVLIQYEKSYSQNGQSYINKVSQIIRYNSLQQYDNLTLDKSKKIVVEVNK